MNSTEGTWYDAVVVGAGFAGLYQLHRLRQMGLKVCAIEAADDVGGTWYWNRYPGARCDIESMAYSFSFSAELEQEWRWSEKYATQSEILRYANYVANKFDLRRDIAFSTRVTDAQWNATTARWEIETDGTNTIAAQFMVLCTGSLSSANLPDIAGASTFKGRYLHTGQWPHEPVDFTGLRVGVIGTGSSAIQSIPCIAEEAAELVVFQRTPNFSSPALNRPLTDAEVADRKADYPAFREQIRNLQTGVPREPATLSTFEVSEEARQAAYQRAWDSGILGAVNNTFTDIMRNSAANEQAAEFIRGRIREAVIDPQTAEDLTPAHYPLGAKRPCLDTNYYETYNLPHVRLVNLRRTPIEAITTNGIRTLERAFELDVIVLATGFDAITGAINAIRIAGATEETLAEKWAAGPMSYLGLMSAGFPNLFTITGPLSPSVLTNMMISIEQHVEWVADLIAFMRDNGYDSVDASLQAEAEWGDHVAATANETLFPFASSWYMGANIPGKPRVFMLYLGGLPAYRKRCSDIAADGYTGFDFESLASALPIDSRELA